LFHLLQYHQHIPDPPFLKNKKLSLSEIQQVDSHEISHVSLPFIKEINSPPEVGLIKP
jgi:hypothetical protein